MDYGELKVFKASTIYGVKNKVSTQGFILPSVFEYIDILHSLRENFYDCSNPNYELNKSLVGFFLTSTKSRINEDSLTIDDVEVLFPFYKEISSSWRDTKKNPIVMSVFNKNQLQKIGGIVKKLSLKKVDTSPASAQCENFKGIEGNIVFDFDFYGDYMEIDFLSSLTTKSSYNGEIKVLGYKL